MRYRRDRGSAVIELALLLPIVTMLLLGLIEIGNALNGYLTVSEASRDSARLIVRVGPTADIYGLTRTLTERLPLSNVQANASYGFDMKGNKTVTVEVKYDYKFLAGYVPVVAKFMPNPFTLTARTTMPIP